MLGKIYLKTETLIQEAKAKNKSEVAVMIGISATDFYNFFAGNRIMKTDRLQIIANHFKVSLKEVKKEHNDNVTRYMKKDR